MLVAISSAPMVRISDVTERVSGETKLQVVTDPAAELCKSYGFQTIYEMPEELQRSVRLKLIEDHFAALNAGGDRLFDHSIFPWIADWMRWFWNNTKTLDWEKVWARAAECARKYDSIYHVEGEVVRNYDGYYWLDQANSVQIDRLIKTLYQEFGVADRVKFERIS